jgi:hypothetical protein
MRSGPPAAQASRSKLSRSRKRPQPKRQRDVRARRRALSARAIRVTFCDALPSLVAVFWRDLAARRVTSNRIND